MSTHPTSVQSDDSANKTSSTTTLNRHIAQYSLAAAAAGVSLLALAQPAASEVVVTRKTIPIPMTTSGTPEPVKISLANNGVNNFSFSFSGDSTFRTLLVGGVSKQDGIVAGGTWDAYAFALGRGANIGPNLKDGFFDYYRQLVELSASENSVGGNLGRYCKGYWGSGIPRPNAGCGNPKDRYLGVRFQMNNQFHYGWIRLTVATNPQLHGPYLTAKITGYAYETVANKPILAGTAAGTAATAGSVAEGPTAEVQAPKKIQNHSGPSLGMLATGADALPMWRREDTLTSN